MLIGYLSRAFCDEGLQILRSELEMSQKEKVIENMIRRLEIDEGQFWETLDVCSKTFENWRYFYESKDGKKIESNPKFLKTLQEELFIIASYILRSDIEEV